ncbi:DUF2550 domain-containing protein [Actinotalea subterranea]|uniref:DUF2550 domain-containing protein n=1 Tax=Actinotalea subterranea TaxID=2607497 RepID=UPI0011EFDFD1|nr:DUF2550 domain-containing protein [Actinotalea subterranea]
MEVLAALLGVGALLLALAVPLGLYLSRQSTLSRRVGSFTCQLRDELPDEDTGWVAGIAQYGTARIVWWRTLSLAPRPARTWSRNDLVLLERVPLDEVDDAGRAMMLVHCRHHEERFQLTMSVAACAGLVSWLESGPRPVGRVL